VQRPSQSFHFAHPLLRSCQLVDGLLGTIEIVIEHGYLDLDNVETGSAEGNHTRDDPLSPIEHRYQLGWHRMACPE
jgi:hypothetical protein